MSQEDNVYSDSSFRRESDTGHHCTTFRENLIREHLKAKALERVLTDADFKRKYAKWTAENQSLPSCVVKLPPVHPAVEKWFQTMDTKNVGKITSKELQQAFEIFQGKRFSDSACKFVVRLFDLDKNGGLDVREFEALYYHIKQWVNAFNTYDTTKSGFLDEHELDCALKTMDINFSSDFIRFLIQRNNPKAKKISLDQYIITCIQIQRYTDEFKSRDLTYSGNINIKYEDFLEMIMRCL